MPAHHPGLLELTQPLGQDVGAEFRKPGPQVGEPLRSEQQLPYDQERPPLADDVEGGEVTLLRLPGYSGGEPQQPVPRDVVAGMIPLEDGRGTSQWKVDFWIDDAASAAAKAPELGGRVLAAPHHVPGFRRTVLADPSGAAFSVSELQLGH